MTKFPSKFKDDSAKSIGFLFIRTYNIWHREIKKQLKEISLTHPQFVVLTTLGFLAQKNEDINQALISKAADIDVMTVSSIIKKLEQSGLVVRKISKKDPRANTIYLTKKGEKKLECAIPIVEKIDDIFFSSLNDDETFFREKLLTLSNFDFSSAGDKKL